jgi:hypothetical protein
MSFNIPYTAKVNEQPATLVTNEVHTIGIVGTQTYATGTIRLVQVPQGPAPAVHITGYVEITTGTPVGNQFLVNYTTGGVTFNPSLNGTVVTVSSYQGLGSEIAAEDVNELQNPVSTIATQTIVYNWPLAPTVSWALANGIVNNASISPSAGIALTKLQPLAPSIVPVTDSSGFLTSSSTSTTELSYLDATSSIQTQLNSKAPAGSYISSLTGDVTAVGPGAAPATVQSVGGSTAANVNTAVVTVAAATNLDTASTLVKRDGSGGFSAGNVTIANNSSLIFTDLSGPVRTITLNTPPTLTASYVLVWPLNQGAAGTFLRNDGFGNLNWFTVTASAGGSNGQIQFNNSGSLAGASGLTWDSTNDNLTINTSFSPALNIIAPSIGIEMNGTSGINDASYVNAFLFRAGNGAATSPGFTFTSDTQSGMYLKSTGDILTLSSIGVDAMIFDAADGLNQSLLSLLISTVPGDMTDPSAALQVNSTTQGFLPPTMTTSDRLAISSPAEGLMVYDTDLHQWAGWNGSSWSLLG